MLPSSAASKPSSAGSSAVARFERAVAPFARRFSEAPAVVALRETLPPAIIITAVILVALALGEMRGGLSTLAAHLTALIPRAFAFGSLAMLTMLAWQLAGHLALPRVGTLVVTVCAFATSLPSGATRSLDAFAATLGASGLFTAIVVALAVAGSLVLGRRRFGALPGFAIGAATLILVLFAFHLAGFSIAGVIKDLLAPFSRLGDTPVALFIIVGVQSILWLFGIHGSAVFAAITLPTYTALQFANTAAAHAHAPLPHLIVVSTFLFVFPGGAGASLPLVLLLLRSRVPRLRSIARATLVPSLLNANEPITFGLPIAFNPVLALPFVLAPLVLCATTYAALATHLVRAPAYYVFSTIPVLLNVYLATFDPRAIALAFGNLLIAAAIWFPFVRVYERLEAQRVPVTV
jgi:PTS system cellobiose-specific IIC component